MNNSILAWKFWDNWLQKLFVQLISVKVMALVATVILCILGFVNGGNLAVIFGVIFGAKGAFQVANVFNKNGKNQNIVDKV